MSDWNLAGDPPIPVRVRRSGRARRMSLRVSRLDGRVTLTLPNGVNERDGRAFIEAQEPWLRRQLGERPEAAVVGFGVQIPVDGRPARVVAVDGPTGGLVGDRIEVPSAIRAPGAYVEDLLKAAARERLSAASDRYAAQLSRSYARLTLRDTRSRWGSCSSKGGLMYSWRLIMAPPDVQDYVAAHEVAHLAEMNHSTAFWAIVARLYPGYERPRRWLRENGTELHRYRFRD